MATERENPYNAFNFLVESDGELGDAEKFQGGFQEVSGLGEEIAVAEYRNGNEKENHPRKIMGLAKAGDVTLKRGVIGATSFFDWLKIVREGDQEAGRTVSIRLLDEAREGPVMTWILTNARPMKYTGPTLNAKGGDVAMEELVLSCEKIVVE